jgi:hypothetical protein
LGETRRLLLAALLDCDTAALYLASGLKQNPQDFEIGLKYLESCNQKLEEPKAQLQAFMSGNVTPEDGAVGIVARPSCPAGCTELQPGCIIKGDVNELGGKVYYLPGSARYADVTIEPDNGERWFCSVQEIILNGWQQPAAG